MCLQYKSFENTVGERKKLLIMGNFPFSHNLSYPFGELSAIFIEFEIVVCKHFQFLRVQNLSFGNELLKKKKKMSFCTNTVLFKIPLGLFMA